LQRDVQHRHQNFIEYSRRIQLARGLQKQDEFFQVRGFLLDLDAGDLAEKFPSRVGSCLSRIEQEIGGVSRAKFQTVAPFQFLPLDTLSIHESAVFASQIDEEKIFPLLHDLRMVAGDARVGDHQILVGFSSDREGAAVQHNVLLLAALYEHQGGKYPGA
jgi:hypothetical protein